MLDSESIGHKYPSRRAEPVERTEEESRRMSAPSISPEGASASPAKDVRSDPKMRLTVKSRKVLVRIEEYSQPLVSMSGVIRLGDRRKVRVYDYVLDERQARAVAEARELAQRSGVALEVTDLSRKGALWRALSSGRDRMGGLVVHRETARPQGEKPGRIGPTRQLCC
jgi:hypothetical protein